MARRKKLSRIYDVKLMSWLICLLASIFYAYDFLLRVQPSVMVHELMQFFNTNAVGIGFLSSFYYYAYTPLQIPTGLVVDKYSTRIVLTISALLCGIGAFLFGLVDNYAIALFARLLMGAGSAFAFTSALKLAARWLPHERFALFTGIATGLGTIGAMSTNIILSRMVAHMGWQETVIITGYIAIVLAILIFLIVRNKPNHAKPIPREFKNWGHAWHRLLFIAKQWQFWINGIVGCLLFMPVSVFGALWGGAFIKRAYNLPTHNATTFVALLFLGTAIGGPLAGWISDYIKKRRIPLFVGTGLACLLTFAILYEIRISYTTLYIMLFFLGVATGSQILVFSVAKEISPPKTTGSATASTNFIVTLGAAVFQPLIGYLLVKFWQGGFSAAGIPHYSLQTYRHALLVLPISLIVAFFLIFLLPETNCQPKFKYLKKHYQ